MKNKKPPAGRKMFDGKDEKTILAKLEQVFMYGGSDEEACLFADISVDALYRYEKKNIAFRKRKALLKSRPVLQAREAVINAFKENPRVAWEFLKHKAHKEFKMALDATVTDEESLTDEEKEALRNVLRQNGLLKTLPKKK